jgi:hypothetical protein
VTVGSFDGVHLGHQAVLAEVARRAQAAGRASVLVTFEPHPLAVINPPAAPALLTTGPERREILALTPIDYALFLWPSASRRLAFNGSVVPTGTVAVDGETEIDSTPAPDSTVLEHAPSPAPTNATRVVERTMSNTDFKQPHPVEKNGLIPRRSNVLSFKRRRYST